MSALGMVETKGLVGAVEAADAMLKTADVALLEKSLAGGGLVTITVTGEVAAVQAAVAGAVAAVGRIAGAQVVSSHVIPRPVEELAHVIRLQPAPASPGTPPAAPAPTKAAAPANPVAAPKPAAPAKPAVQAKPVEPVKPAATPAAPAKPAAATPPAKPAASGKGKRRGTKK